MLPASDVYQSAIRNYRQLVDSALTDVEEFCEKNTWLCDINRYCIDWTATQLSQLKDAPSYVMEVSLQSLL